MTDQRVCALILKYLHKYFGFWHSLTSPGFFFTFCKVVLWFLLSDYNLLYLRPCRAIWNTLCCRDGWSSGRDWLSACTRLCPAASISKRWRLMKSSSKLLAQNGWPRIFLFTGLIKETFKINFVNICTFTLMCLRISCDWGPCWFRDFFLAIFIFIYQVKR